MANRFSIFLAMGATVIAVMLLYPPHALGLMSKETLMSFNKGGMDLLPDVRGIIAEGNVTYTITVKEQKKDKDGDGVPNHIETNSPFCLDPNAKNTHDISIGGGFDGDNEILAMDAESKSSNRVKRELDWASPGSQSKKAR